MMPTSHANCLGTQTIGLTQEAWMPSGWHLAEQLAPDLESEVIENARRLAFASSHLLFTTVSVPAPLLACHLL
jgi:hypothetical protein